jgi:hypothetical protein
VKGATPIFPNIDFGENIIKLPTIIEVEILELGIIEVGRTQGGKKGRE